MGRVLYDVLPCNSNWHSKGCKFPHFDDTIPGPGDDHTLGGLTQVDVADDVAVPLGCGFRDRAAGCHHCSIVRII